jgi:hypothetical protein
MFTEHQYAYVASGDTPWLPVDESGVAGALRKLEVSKTEDQPSPFDYSGTPQLLDRTRIQDPKLKRAAMNPPPRPAYSEQEIKINELGRDIDKKMDDVMAGIDPADQAAVNARFEQLRKTMAAESGDADVSTINNRAKLQALADYVAGTISYGDLRPVSIIMKNEMQIDLMTMSRMSERRQQYITAKAKMEADQAQLQRDLDARESALATEALRKRNDELRRADPADPSNWE